MLLSAGMLLLANMHILQRTLSQQALYQTRQVSALLDQSIAIPLAQRDYAVLQQTIDRVISDESINYIVLFDHRGRQIASAGWNPKLPLPPRSTDKVDLSAPDGTRHLASVISLSGQTLGSASFGLSTRGLRASQSIFERQSVGIAAITLLVSIALITALATALTRHLMRLEQSSQRIASGDFNVTVPVVSDDEIGRLAASFNSMAATLRDRMNALQASEELQKHHLLVAITGQSRLTALIDAIPTGILFVDNGLVMHANGAFSSIWGLADDLAGSPIVDMLPRLRSLTMDSDVACLEYLLRAPQVGERLVSIELRTTNGRLISQQVRRVPQPGGRSGYLCLHEDVTLARHIQHRARQALLDPLTQLPNRRGLFEALVDTASRAAEKGSSFLLMFVDLDDFKHANDVGGHRVGDEILVTVGATLSAQLRATEMVARLGGDEFAVICPDMNLEQGGALATRLVDAISNLRFPTESEVLQVGCSVGLASYPDDATTPDDLIKCADTAMYQVKQRGKNGWLRYQPKLKKLASDDPRNDWSGQIHRALNEERFVLFYQPVFHAKDLQVAYHEVLVRMVGETDPTHRISPSDFLPHAEKSGKVREIDRWVFDGCIKQLGQQPGLVLAVNLSANSFEDKSFSSFLREALQRHDVDPRRLHIEINETAVIKDPSIATAMIGRLRALGCAVHLDDVGNGFGSFSHLKSLDIDTIKIDGAFVRDLENDANNQMFVGAMIAIARQLNKTTIAKHVENKDTLDVLVKLGVDCVQGFYIARPAREPAGRKPQIVLLKRGDAESAN